MDLFTFYNPTKLIFGKGQIEALKDEVPQYGKKVLIVYGGGSIKKNGIYDKVLEELRAVDAEVYELSGVEPNPRISTVRKGADICKKNDVDLVLAIGGGSVIDCSKTIAAAALYDGEPWDLVMGKAKPEKVLPLGTILTLAATGSEMNSGAVITNWETHEKYGWGTPLLYPKFSILDPENTYSVPRDQTVYGIVDMMSHVLEQYYFNSPNSPLQERFCESILTTVIETAPKLLEDLHHYEYRETIMYCGTMALNNMIRMGTKGDWGSHNLEHAVSAVYDIPHGGGLAILFPNWIRHTLDHGLAKTKQLAVRVFKVDPEGKSDNEIALEGIERLRDFWNQLGAPATLAEYQIDEDKLDLMTDRAMAKGTFGGFRTLDREDVVEIYKMSM